ncbi:hypothetical protein PQX77_018417 [Marasmius sp. AFHP31]|nr:hypothetical protein PQX77_018417 [Marasmius sp. AFHP31]
MLGDNNTDRGCKPGDRPCIITSIKNDHTFVVCLMATFDKNSYEELPDIIKEFIVLVTTTNPSDKSSLNTRLCHIHTTPEWVVPPAFPGSQYLITLPVTARLVPFKRWRTSDMPSDAGFFLDKITMSKLDTIILEHANRSKEWLVENSSLKATRLLQELRALERRYKSRNRAADDDRATLASRRTWGTRGTRSALSAGFTPIAEGGTEDVDGYKIVGSDGKQVKPGFRRSRAPSSRAPSTVASTYGPRRSALSAFGVVHE